jgi:hypothetical protein
MPGGSYHQAFYFYGSLIIYLNINNLITSYRHTYIMQ